MKRIDVSRLRSLMQSTVSEQDREHFEVNMALFEPMSALVGTSYRKYCYADLSPDDILALLRCQYIEECKEDDVQGTIITFTVNEVAKQRRRWIVWPREQNDKVPYSTVQLPSASATISEALKFDRCICIDLKACYNQFSIHPSIRSHFCFSVGASWFRLCTIPTGGRQPPAIAEIALRALSQSSSSVVSTFIDNARFGGNDDATVNAAADSFYARVAFVNATVNERREDLTPVSEYDFLGVHYRHSPGRVSVSCLNKTLAKLSATQPWQQLTLRDLLGIFGRLSWCTQVLGLKPYKYYYVYKMLRRRVGQHLDECAHIWPSCIESWQRWTLEALANQERVVHAPSSNGACSILFTDASLSGYGAIGFRSDLSVVVCSGPWPETLVSINVLEAQALEAALLQLDLDQVVDVFVDNTSVMFSLRKIRSPAFMLNAIIGRIDALNRVRTINYVKSECNPADPLSRLYE